MSKWQGRIGGEGRKNPLLKSKKELAELKVLRKQFDQQINRYSFEIFKILVKETVGEEQYKKLIEKMKSELEAYKISGLMRHEYTRSNSKNNVTSINKI